MGHKSQRLSDDSAFPRRKNMLNKFLLGAAMQVGWVSSVQDQRVASFRYRVEAPMAGLRARDHKVEMFDPSKADAYETVVFSKAYSAQHRNLARAVRRRGGRVIFDLCDNHFYNPLDLPKYQRAREELAEMISIADRVICSTPALARILRDESNISFEPNVIGDIVERFAPAPPRAHNDDGPIRLVWFGSQGSPNAPSGITDLVLIREQLEDLAARHPIELTVCSNSKAKFDHSIAPMRLPTRYVEWSLEGFSGVLTNSDAVVLPMSVNPFTACKTHNRLTTALYAGVPVVASGIDSYREFGRYCTLDDWAAGLQSVVDDSLGERQRALRSRDHIDRRWTNEALSAQWEAALSLPMKNSEASTPALHIHGRLDSVARTAVTGWARAPLNPDIHLQVILECDGEPVAVAVADKVREDLGRANLPMDCGFSLPLPPRLSVDALPRLTVRVLGSDWIVGENPILISDRSEPSFALHASPEGARSEGPTVPFAEQRWDVSEAIASQNRALKALKATRDSNARDRVGALKATFMRENVPPSKVVREAGAGVFRDLLRETDINL